MRLSPRSLFFVLIAAFAFGATHRALAQSPQRPVVELHVDAVLASDTNQGMDKRLAWMGHQLQGLFGFSTYHLETHEDGQTECGKMMTFALPGGHILHVQPRAVDGNMIAMELVLFEGARPMMTTDLKLKNNGRLIVGGPRYQDGMLIISIGANTLASNNDE
jgi:hypothetical protein